MRFTVLCEFGWCGFGWSGDLLPELRLGIVRFACCKGAIVERMRKLRDDLARARNAILCRVA